MTTNLTCYSKYTGLIFGIRIWTAHVVIRWLIPFTCSGVIYTVVYADVYAGNKITALIRITVALYALAVYTIPAAGWATCAVAAYTRAVHTVATTAAASGIYT